MSKKFFSVLAMSFGMVISLVGCGGDTPAPTPKYTVKWLNYNGDVLEVDENVAQGSMPEYNSDTPKRIDPSGQYSYTFAGWDPSLKPVTSDVEYRATFNSGIKYYTITWDVDGELTEESYPYGDMPQFDGDPQKEDSEGCHYSFSHWYPDIQRVTADQKYTAVFDSSPIPYTITWVVEDHSDIVETYYYGDTPSYSSWYGRYDSETGTYVPYDIDATAEYNARKFIRWDPAITTVTSNQTYTAIFEEATYREYTVHWMLGYDEIATEKYHYNDTPTWKGEDPVMENTERYEYEFTGWSYTGPVHDDLYIHAEFETHIRYYAITWIVDGVETTTYEMWNEYPEYPNGTPQKESTVDTEYYFYGWEPYVEYVDGDATYTAKFESYTRRYTISFVEKNKTTKKVIEYGYFPEYTPDDVVIDDVAYLFVGFDKKVCTVTGDETYTALYETMDAASYNAFYYYGGIAYDKDLHRYVTCSIHMKDDADIKVLNVPKYMRGAQVVEVMNLSNHPTLTNVSLPDTVTIFPDMSGCTSLESINVPEPVRSVSLAYLSGITNDLYNVDDNIIYFASNSNPHHLAMGLVDTTVSSITLHEDTVAINDEAFKNLTLDTLTLNDGLLQTGWLAFESTTIRSTNYNGSYENYIKLVFNFDKKDKKLNSMQQTSFIYCSERFTVKNIEMQRVDFPSGTTSINSGTFTFLTTLNSVEMCDEITSIGRFAFWACENLRFVTMSESVTHIPYGAFAFNYVLKSFDLPEGLITIADNAFASDFNLTYIEIPSTVEAINVDAGGYGAFANCFNLATVINHSLLDITKGSSNYGYIAYYALEVVTDRSEMHMVHDEDGFTTVEIDGEMTVVDYDGPQTQLVIPNRITRISPCAFAYNTHIKSVTIPTTINYIGGAAFYNCSNLEVVNYNAIAAEDVKMPDNMTPANCFTGTKVRELNIGNEVTRIPAAVFAGLNIESVNIPASVTSIGSGAFNSCNKLLDVTLHEGLKTIEQKAFLSCNKLSSINIPASVETFGHQAFYRCTELDLIYFEDGFTSFGGGRYQVVFFDCGFVDVMRLPSSTTEIYSYNFDSTDFGMIYFGGTSSEWSTARNNFSSYIFATPNSSPTLKIVRNSTYQYVSVVSNGDSSIVGFRILDKTITSFSFYQFSAYSNVMVSKSAFVGCNDLVTLDMSADNITYITENACYECSSLATLYLGKGLYRICNSAFAYCTSLETIRYSGTTGEFKNIYLESRVFYKIATTSVTCTNGSADISYYTAN